MIRSLLFSPLRGKMKTFLITAATAALLIVPSLLGAENKQALPPDPPIYVIANDDGLLHTYATFFVAGGTQNNPTLTYVQNVNTQGQGIGGGFFGTPRLAMMPSSSAQCLYVSDAGTGDIAAINLQTQQLVGNFLGSSTDNGNGNGIGMVVNANYLYAGYTTSNTIGTFAVGSNCQLSFLGDIAVTPLNGGW